MHWLSKVKARKEKKLLREMRDSHLRISSPLRRREMRDFPKDSVFITHSKRHMLTSNPFRIDNSNPVCFHGIF